MDTSCQLRLASSHHLPNIQSSPQIDIVPVASSNTKIGSSSSTSYAIMPPNPKVPNNELVWNAISNQIDVAQALKTIWNRLDHDRLVADMGVDNRNAASKRFARWVAAIAEQSNQLNKGVTDNADIADKVEPVAKVKKEKKAGSTLKNDIKKEGGVFESGKKGEPKKGAGKKEAYSKGTRMKDRELTDEWQEK
ncbi:hypothetical protein NHQ30_005040 [Ciborinia camelliae]|nr:hypothetical protein NHQ30_005040 [Ciborinia camelliae]